MADTKNNTPEQSNSTPQGDDRLPYEAPAWETQVVFERVAVATPTGG